MPIEDAESSKKALNDALALPRLAQPAAIAAISERIHTENIETWNSKFGPESLFDAWTGTHLARGIYTANADLLRTKLGSGWKAIEVGGGDGRLWARLPNLPSGDLWVVDPSPGVHERLRTILPSPIRLHSVVDRIEEVHEKLPEADVVVCSLMLHHVAGADVKERARHGLEGPGKLEILRSFDRCIRARGGFLVVNEADVYCDLGLAPGDPLLRDRLIDSYVRRTARALCGELAELERDGDPSKRHSRILALIKHWCLDQVKMADRPIAERDVYELDVPRWLTLFERADLHVVERGPTDDSLLFHRYLLQSRSL